MLTFTIKSFDFAFKKLFLWKLNKSLKIKIWSNPLNYTEKYMKYMKLIFRKLSLFISPKIHIYTLTQAELSTYSLRKMSLKSRPCNGFEDFGSHGSLHKIAVLCKGGRICQQRTYYRIKTIIYNLQPLLTIHPHYCSHFLHALFLHKVQFFVQIIISSVCQRP